ncbi:flagellar protein FlaI [Nitrosopumilus sp. b1]|uniref:type II/IV secretion system ATPase subunit n=1 Tax=Nitrosopumilus sp. b1 TaxID=2109907 RepID=UPI0015F5A7F3|nr:type II/IV secretion system ATPase subunit [Nitrosopumilus sp. b1]KAF6243110.1 flagellar protein FlaI [Nitrosopumilus sp. b1]
MAFDFSQVKDKNFSEVLKKTPHLLDYIDSYSARGNPLPLFTDTLKPEHKKLKEPNLMYPISEQAFIHINPHTTSDDGYLEYVIIEPPPPERKLMEMADKLFAVQSGSLDPPVEITERFNMVENYLDKAVSVQDGPVDYEKVGDVYKLKTLPVEKSKWNSLKYHFLQKRAGTGLLDPFLSDPNLEDISIIGAGNVYVIHKSFGALKSPLFLGVEEIDELIISMSEQFGKTVSHAKPVVDSVLPDGSRINIVFGKDISRKGTNATIRKFASTPLSIIQVLTSKALDFREAAYMWMMLSEGMSVFINGETASGKTTTLMALTAFIPSNWKVVTIEDTPELTLPHSNWITEATRDTGSPSSSVTMFDLLKAALRQRPNYILVGEIRGAEGNIAFQAMQTGHPVISTFHAANMVALIQRLSNDPINIPKTHMENLNIALFQGAVQGPGGKRVRRVLSINEILGYNPDGGNIMFIPSFSWDPGTDEVKFKGKGSSALFISHVLHKRGMSRKDEGKLYDELELRAKILERMMEKKIFNYYDVFDSISHCREIGLEAFYKELDTL